VVFFVSVATVAVKKLETAKIAKDAKKSP